MDKIYKCNKSRRVENRKANKQHFCKIEVKTYEEG